MPRPYLRIVQPGREERRFPIDVDVLTIGRSAENGLAIPDLSLSREHANIWRDGERYLLRDRKSRNGTFLNEEPVVSDRPLRDGDVVRLGETTLYFCEEGSSGIRLSDHSARLSEGSVAIPATELLSSTFRGAAPQDARLLDVFARASRMLIAKVTSAEILDEVLEAALDAMRAERGTIMLLEGEPSELVPRAVKIRAGEPSFMLSRTIARLVIEERTSLITTDAQLDPRLDAALSVNLQGIRAAISAPLWYEERVLGLLYLDRRVSARHFSESDLALLTVLANLTAAKLENLRLLEEAQAKRKLDEELRLAAEIQKSLLPQHDPVHAGWEFAGMSIASRSVGGDLYDYIPLGHGRLGLVVADVSGKGVSAALLMASLRANVRAFALSSPDPAQMMVNVNRAVHMGKLRNRFATVIFVELDPRAGQARYVSAGHNPGLLVRPDGSVTRLSVGGLIVGAFDEVPRYALGEFRMEPGDLLVLYSDGVTEASGVEGELFGEDRLERLVSTCAGRAAAEVRDLILEEVHCFTRGSAPSDDTTLLVARRLPG